MFLFKCGLVKTFNGNGRLIMGYALFAHKKLMYTAQLNMYEQKLNEIAEQRLTLSEFTINIEDGFVTSEEYMEDYENQQNYIDFENAYNGMGQNYIQVDDGHYISQDQAMNPYQMPITDETTGAEYNDYVIRQEQMMEAARRKQFAKDYVKRLEHIDNELEQKQKKLETLVTATTNQLQAVEQAEAKAIERATPKYTGVG